MGMTLTEILVVISIMVILVTAVVAAAFRVSSKSPVQATRGLLEKLAVGLESYKATYRMYPPQDNIADPIGSPPPPYPDYPQLDLNPSPTLQIQATTFLLWYALEYQGQGQFMAPVSSTYKAAGGCFTDSTNNSVQTWYYYQDAWQQPIRYICTAPYNQYTLTSGGPDLMLGTADDIVVP